MSAPFHLYLYLKYTCSWVNISTYPSYNGSNLPNHQFCILEDLVTKSLQVEVTSSTALPVILSISINTVCTHRQQAWWSPDTEDHLNIQISTWQTAGKPRANTHVWLGSTGQQGLGLISTSHPYNPSLSGVHTRSDNLESNTSSNMSIMFGEMSDEGSLNPIRTMAFNQIFLPILI